MSSALVASTNTYYVALEDALGSITPGVQISQAMGMHYDNTVTQKSADFIIQHQIASFTLGFNATNPLDLANAYATVAAGGTRCEPTPVTAVLDQNGQPAKNPNGQVYDTGDHCTPNAIAPGVANTLANMMVGVVSPAGTGRKAIIPGHTIGGKTGTTQDNFAAAFGGITPDYSLAIQYFDPAPKDKTPVGGVGGGVPAQIFHDAMAPILGAQPDHPFPPADPAVEAGTKGPGPGASAADAGSGDQGATTGGDGGAAGGAGTGTNTNGNG
jgi:membrane peptidoglycan carboxypeptidase